MTWGCVRDLEPISKKQCLNQSDNCKTCVGNDCNSMKHFQRCYSNDADENPTTFQASEDNNKTKICKMVGDKCFTLITEKDVIIKDCLHDYAEKKNISIDFLEKDIKSLYDVCTSSLCNSQDIRPTYCYSKNDKNCKSIPLAKIKPITCVSCDSSVDATCATKVTSKMITSCPLFKSKLQQCYHYINKTSAQHIRGKVSTILKSHFLIFNTNELQDAWLI